MEPSPHHPIKCLHTTTFKYLATSIVSLFIALMSISYSIVDGIDDDSTCMASELDLQNIRIGVIETKVPYIKDNANQIRINAKILSDIRLDYVRVTGSLSNSITKLNVILEEVRKQLDSIGRKRDE